MKDPERLLSSREASAHERTLLEAGVAEEPPTDGAARLALALGLPPLITLASPPSAAEAATAKAAGVGTAAAVKWLALVTGTALVAGSAYFAYDRATPPQREEGRELAPSVTRAAPTPEVEQAVEPEAADPRSSLRAPEEGRSTSIAEEITRLERVRYALKQRDTLGALRELSAYDRSFARGALREEADILRIEASVMLGEKQRARALGGEFLRVHPSSVHGARVRRLLESLDGG